MKKLVAVIQRVNLLEVMTKIKIYRRSALLVVHLFMALVLASCASAVREQDRDTDSKFRGFWSASISNTPSQSLAGSYSTNCWDLDGMGHVQIAGGRVVARVAGYDLAGFIDTNGRFSASLNLSGQWKFRLRGLLNVDAGTGEGWLTHNRKGEGLAGCTSKLDFKKEPG